MYDKLTANDIRRMEEEIEDRKVNKRHELLEAVKEARAQGDLSENFEYKAAKREKNRNESRIRYLEKMVRTAQVIEDTSAADEVGVDNTVTVRYIEDDEEETFKLVTSIRADSVKDLIAIDSPMGKAVLRKKVGDRVTVRVNADICFEVEIVKIENTKDEGKESLASY